MFQLLLDKEIELQVPRLGRFHVASDDIDGCTEVVQPEGWCPKWVMEPKAVLERRQLAF